MPLSCVYSSIYQPPSGIYSLYTSASFLHLPFTLSHLPGSDHPSVSSILNILPVVSYAFLNSLCCTDSSSVYICRISAQLEALHLWTYLSDLQSVWGWSCGRQDSLLFPVPKMIIHYHCSISKCLRVFFLPLHVYMHISTCLYLSPQFSLDRSINSPCAVLSMLYLYLL